jgi:polysaccharide export outer membrane protein
LGVLLFVGLASPASAADSAGSEYIIGPGDSFQVFVWHNPDLSATVPVRPDGRISIPLVEDIDCAGKTPTQLAREIEDRLKKFVQDPTVTIIMTNSIGLSSQQIRIVGQAAQPKALPYRANMSVLDAMIAVGGLTPYASGNRAKLIRTQNGRQVALTVRLQDLLEDADMSANTPLQPGDIIMIPQSFF